MIPKSREAVVRLLAPIVLISIASVTGCSEEPADGSHGPYYEDIKAAASRASSDFERDVLADGEIARAEYEDAVQRLVACAEDQGVTVIPHDQSGLYTYEVPGGDPDDVMRTCSEGNTIVIEDLYGQTVHNPKREDLNELMAACFVRTGLAEAGYSGDDYKSDMEKASGGPAEGAFPFDVDDERFAECNYNPSAQ